MLEFLFQPFLFMLALPGIVWQLAPKEKKLEFLQDIGISLVILLIFISIKYGL